MKSTSLLNEVIELPMIAFIGASATYYSAEYVTALNLTPSHQEYWYPLIAAVITMYFAIKIIIRVFKKIKNRGKK